MTPVAANAPVNDRVEPTTIGLLLVVLFVVAFLVLHAAAPLATSSSAATTDRMRLDIVVSFRFPGSSTVSTERVARTLPSGTCRLLKVGLVAQRVRRPPRRSPGRPCRVVTALSGNERRF